MLMTVTNAGISKATVAAQNGYQIKIDKYKLFLGSIFYELSVEDDAVPGTQVHAGNINSVTNIGSGELEYRILVDHIIGDFSFNFVGLYLTDGTLFAYGNLTFLQEKRKTTSGLVGNTLDFKCVTKLSPSLNHTINLYLHHPLSNFAFPEIELLSMLEPPSDSMNAVIVKEKTSKGDSTLAIRRDTSTWSFVGFSTTYKVVVTGISGSNISFAAVPQGLYLSNPLNKAVIASVVSGPASGRARFVTASNAARTQHTLQSNITGLTTGSLVEIQTIDDYYAKSGGLISGPVIVNPPAGKPSLKIGNDIELTTDNLGNFLIIKNGNTVFNL